RGSRRGRGHPWVAQYHRICVIAQLNPSTIAVGTAGLAVAAAAAVPAERGAAVAVAAVAADIETGPGARCVAETLVEGLRAVVARSDRDRLAVQERGPGMGVDARQVERHHPASLGGVERPVDADVRHRSRQDVERVGDELALM